MLYCINEKKAIQLLETFEYKPKTYAERVNHVFEVLGLSIFKCYDMTEKLYKEAGNDEKSIFHWHHLMTTANNDRHTLRIEKSSAVKAIVERYKALSMQLMQSEN